MALACLSLLALAGLFTAPSAMGTQTRPFLSEFTGSDTPAGSLDTADKLAVHQSTGNVWVIDKQHQVLDKFDASGSYISQIAFGSWGADPDVAVDNSGTGTQGNVAAAAEFGPVRVFDSSGTPLFQLDGSTTPDGEFNDDCGLAIDPNNGDIYVAEYGQQAIDKFDSSGNFITQFPVGFGVCDIAVDTDGTIWAVQWNNSLHKLDSSGADQGVVDPNNPSAVNIDPATHHVYSDRRSSIAEYDSSGNLVVSFGGNRLENSRGVDINSSSGNVYASSNPLAGSRVVIFGPVTLVPDVTTGNATNVSGTSATLNGRVAPEGGDITNCHFEYSIDTSYGKSAPCVPAGTISSPTDVSARISGLEACTVYHFRLVAANANGANTGNDQTFLSSFSAGSSVGCFGGSGSGPGQFQTPIGVATDSTSGNVYVADSQNARVEKFDPTGHFLAAWGWGVTDGQPHSEVCTSGCQAGIAGSGPGQFSRPTSIAATGGRVYVGDANNNVVGKFNSDGGFITTIDGSNTPQGHFVSLAGVAGDKSGNLWTADAGTNNVDEFDAHAAFVRQWTDTAGSPSAIAVDSSRGKVYLITSGETDRWTLTGTDKTMVDPGSGVALGLDQRTGNLFVDHGGDVAAYDPTGIPVAKIQLASSDSRGLAYSSLSGMRTKPGYGYLYVSDASLNNVTFYVPPTKAGKPMVTLETATQTGATTATLTAGIVPLGFDTTCKFQYVDEATFEESGYDNATETPCTPSDLGSGFTYVGASADLTGLTRNTVYHYRAVATNSAGTTNGADQTFQEVFAWAPFDRCPVDDPAMLAADGVTTLPVCLASNSTHGSITFGNLSNPTGNINLQMGILIDTNAFTFTVVAPPAGAVLADPIETSVTVGGFTLNITAVTESAGAPSNFDLLAGLSTGVPIMTLPVKIHLLSNSLGPNCYIGSDQNPILLHPANTDLSNAEFSLVSFDPDGVPDPNGPLGALTISGATQGDDTFEVPGAQGCGINGLLDPLVNFVSGLPSPSGNNHLVLEDASSSLALPGAGQDGQTFANQWHEGFGQ